MPVGDLLNWDFLLPQYTDKITEEILRELQPKQTGELSKHDDYIKAAKDYKKNMNKVRYMENMKEKSIYMTFSAVLDMMKKYRQNNLCFRREGWNGKGMYIMLWTDAYMGEYPPDEKVRMVSYELSEMLVLKTSYGKFVPWCPSQTDILCDDWVLLPEQPKTAIVVEEKIKTKTRKGGQTMIVGDKCSERMCEIIMEAGKIKESQLRETLLLEGYDPRVITANIKKLCDYGDIEFYPVMEVVDNVILRNGGIPNPQEEEE